MVSQSAVGKVMAVAALASVASAAATPNSMAIRRSASNSTCLELAKSNGTATKECLNWRPQVHVQPPQGWMNDPCAPGYDTAHSKYHLGMQWTPDGIAWANISWGAAVSDDLINWEISRKTSIEPEASYDYLGVFTGGAFDGAIDGSKNGTITTAYTAVDSLPITWKNNYTRGSESVALAFSEDSGFTWERYYGNIIIEDGPTDVDIVGWRDPYLAEWPSVEQLIHNETGNYLYGIVSGGIRDTTPTTWLYEIDNKALQNWRYVGPLVDISMQYDPSPKWIGGYGANFEVCNFLTATSNDKTITRDYIVCGCEGKNVTAEVTATQGGFRSDKGQTWFQGDWTLVNGTVPQMGYKHGGRIDYGDYYAGNSFYDPITDTHIIWGWVAEDDLPTRFLEAQFWAGALSLPRTMTLWAVDGVKGALQSELSDIASAEITGSTASGLTAIPDSRVHSMRREHTAIKAQKAKKGKSCKAGSLEKETSFGASYPTFELKLSAKVGPSSKPVGVRLLHGNDETTLISFSAADEQITIDRTNSTYWPDIRTVDELAPHTLFQLEDNTFEKLDLDIFYDRSIIEVFANGRTAVTTRVYPVSGAVEGIELVYDESDSASAFVSGDVWTLETSLTYID